MKTDYEILSRQLAFVPIISEYKVRYGVTHYDFRLFRERQGWGIKARPRPEWKLQLDNDAVECL